MSAVLEVTDDSFEREVLQSQVPVLVYFWAPWCGPCRMLAPVVDEVAQALTGQLKVVKLNTDDNTGISSQLGIRSTPTLMVFKGRQKVNTVVGAVPKAALMQEIEKFL